MFLQLLSSFGRGRPLINLDTLDTVIAIVIVLLVLSLIVQAIQSFIAGYIEDYKSLGLSPLTLDQTFSWFQSVWGKTLLRNADGLPVNKSNLPQTPRTLRKRKAVSRGRNLIESSYDKRRSVMNTASQNRLKKVHPELARRVTLLIEALANKGMTVEVVQGLRTFAEQDELFKQGRTKPGQIVTRARGGQSNHNYGLAVDLCPFVNGKPQWNDNAGFIRIGVEAAKQGLDWGGSWKKFIDKPHVQLSGMTIARCLACYNKGGLPNVWSSVPPIV